MVVDAMRSDFMFSESSNMPFAHSLINDRAAIPYTAYSSPPTVTLPRLKGITTGSTPNFLDAILNIAESDTASTLANQDSWLAQLHSQKKKIRMFGDDTWIKLFPDIFEQSDGTASFFVSDYTEVDNNVTRHLDHQLAHSEDWDVLILHYLGLDHIGHKGGPTSPFMPIKQLEMDGIIKRLYKESEDTLIVVLGDHGMNEAGNHGGSSSGETSAAFLLISDKFKDLEISHKAPLPIDEDFNYYTKISQSDLVPTLAALFDFPIPINSLGVFLLDLLPLWKAPQDKTEVLKQNVYQMAHILETTYPGFTVIDAERELFCESLIDLDPISDHQKLECLWWHIQDNLDDNEIVYEFLQLAQRMLSKASSNYNQSQMLTGLYISIGALVISILVSKSFLKFAKPVFFVLLLITGLYAGAMFGSSLVEEEHHLWYWGATGWIAWLYLLTSRRNFVDGFYWVFSMIMVRIVRSWNQTGQKYAGGPDIASFLGSPENAGILWFLIIIYYGSLFGRMWKGSFQKFNPMVGIAVSFITVSASLVFKTHMAVESGEVVPRIVQTLVGIDKFDDPNKLISLARFAFFTIGFCILYEFSNLLLGVNVLTEGERTKPISNMTIYLEAFFVLQSRTTNIPLFIAFNMLKSFQIKAINQAFLVRYQDQIKDTRDSNPVSIRIIAVYSISLLIFKQMAFFAMGNSNSLASIDLSNAYNGVSSYNIPIVGALTFLSNWAGPLYWSFNTFSILLEEGYRGYIIEKFALQRRLTLHDNKNADESDLEKLKYGLTQLYLKDIQSHSQDIIIQNIVINQIFFSGALVGIMGACIVLKDHLFIWTVFSPKLLYAAAWVIPQHIVIDVFAGSVLAFLSS